jgi:hypothetical protein
MPASSLPTNVISHGGSLVINTLSPTFLDQKAQVVLRVNVAEAMPALAQWLLGS